MKTIWVEGTCHLQPNAHGYVVSFIGEHGAVVITHRYDLWGEVLEADETIPKRSPGWIPTDGLLYLLGLRTRVLNCEYDHVRSPKSSAHHLKNLQADPQRKRGDK